MVKNLFFCGVLAEVKTIDNYLNVQGGPRFRPIHYYDFKHVSVENWIFGQLIVRIDRCRIDDFQKRGFNGLFYSDLHGQDFGDEDFLNKFA